MYGISLSCVALILQLFPPIVPISSSGLLTRRVGQNVVFMFNATNINAFYWGIRDGNTNNLKQGLINYNIADGIQLDKKINSTSYAGRVSFVGNLSKGQAWFKITNLNINDTNQYMAQIFTQGASDFKYEVMQLQVKMLPPTTRPLQTSTTASTSFVSGSIVTLSVHRNVTSTPPKIKTYAATTPSRPGTSITENQSNSSGTCTSIIAACVTVIVVLVVVVVVLVIYILRLKEKSARKRSLSSTKGEDLEAYENANQMDHANIHESATPRFAEKEMYETICENKDEGANTKLSHPGFGALPVNDMTTRDSLSRRKRGQDPEPSLMPQHYQDLKNLTRTQQMPLYEPLNKRNTKQSTDAADNPRTYEQLQQNVAGREYQSLQITSKKEENKV